MQLASLTASILNAIRVVAISLPLIFFLLSEWYRYNRRRLVARRQTGKKPPFTFQIQVDAPDRQFVKTESFYLAARYLKYRQISDIYGIDTPQTIRDTIEAGGFPKLAYKPLSRPPEYLILIEQLSYQDHYAHLFDAIVDALLGEGVFVERYFYESSPKVCFQEADGNREYLVELKDRFSNHVLLIFSNGDELLDPISSELKPWTEFLQAWQNRVLLTPEDFSKWGLREKKLEEIFTILPTVPEVLGVLAEYLESPLNFDLRGLDSLGYTPDMPEIYPELENTGLIDSTETVKKLKAYLGEDVFQWFAACAIYPEINWDLTLHLGLLPCMPDNLIVERNLLSLIRLPYFRNGVIPDSLRWALISELSLERGLAIREALVSIFERQQHLKPNTGAYDIYRLNIAIQQMWISSLKRKRSESQNGDQPIIPAADRQRDKAVQTLQKTSVRQIRTDYTFLKFLESEPGSPLSLEIPRHLYGLFFENGVPFFGLKSGIRAIIALLLTAVAFLILNEPNGINVVVYFTVIAIIFFVATQIGHDVVTASRQLAAKVLESTITHRWRIITVGVAIILLMVWALASYWLDHDGILQVTIALLVGVGGVGLLYYLLSSAIERLSSRWQNRLMPVVFIGPALAVLGWYLIVPIIRTIYTSLLTPDGGFSLDNYIAAFNDTTLLSALRNNLIWALATVIFSIGFGLIITFLATFSRYGHVARFIISMPIVISTTVASIMWAFLYDNNAAGEGIVNTILTTIGFEPFFFRTVEPWNTLFLTAVLIWIETGFVTLLLSAYLNRIPLSIVDRARIDGASPYRIYRRIMIPLIRSQIIFTGFFIYMISIRVFDIIFVLTGGQFGSEVIATNQYEQTRIFLNDSLGTAIAVIMLILTIPTILYFRGRANRFYY